MRVPCVMRWPGHIPAGSTCTELAATIDILPTLAGIIDVELSPDRPIDGLDILPLMVEKEGTSTPHEVYYYYWIDELHAVRSGPWKLHFPHTYRHVVEPGQVGLPGKQTYPMTEMALYNLEDDISESRNVLDQHPEVVAKLLKYANAAREDLGDKLQNVTGKNLREPGRIE
ncbi:MAG: hypothetical protein R3C11_05875 [Planctomycetaceae bacterium]